MELFHGDEGAQWCTIVFIPYSRAEGAPWARRKNIIPVHVFIVLI